VLADWQTASQVLAGSPDYMPPEQAMGARVDGRADVYSAAVTCWELLAGKKRIREEGVAARLARAIQAQPEALLNHRHDAPRKLEAIIQQAMHPDPERRTPSAAMFRKALQDELQSAAKKKSAKEDVAAWLDSACATVIAREKRLLEEAREKALAMVRSGDGARTELLVGGQERELLRDQSPYNFYTGVAFVAEGEARVKPRQAIEDFTAPSMPTRPRSASPKRPSSGRMGAYVEKMGSSSTIAALAALVDPAFFKAQSKQVRMILAFGAMGILIGIAALTAVLVRPKTASVEITALPISDEPVLHRPPSHRPLETSPVAAPGPSLAIDPNEDEEDPSASNMEPKADNLRLSGDVAKEKTEKDQTSRALAPEVESKKSEIVRRIKQLRRMRFDISFQRRLTQLSTRLSKARTMKALDEVESALARLENER
jgi:serine/threonine protein kinase